LWLRLFEVQKLKIISNKFVFAGLFVLIKKNIKILSTCFLCSVKPFQSGAFCLAVPKVTPPAPPPAPAWLGRSIATQRLRILEHSAFVDQQRDQDTYHKHLFVHIGSSVDYSDPLLEVRLVVFFMGGVLRIRILMDPHHFGMLDPDSGP
jgi:hypothetical protein